MGLPPKQATNARAEHRAMIALVAVFVLLVQALVPATATAAAAADPAMVICTQAGLQAAPPSDRDPGQPATDHACQHCLCPALASAPPPVFEVRPVAYVLAAAPASVAPRALRPPVRAPPRPPGQGPPSFDA